jgi:hypothetical protein
MSYIKILKEDWEDSKAIYKASRGIATQADLFSDVLKVISILLPFLSSRKKDDPINDARKDLKKLRRDLKRGRIDQEEYDRLRKEVLKKVSPLNKA